MLRPIGPSQSGPEAASPLAAPDFKPKPRHGHRAPAAALPPHVERILRSLPSVVRKDVGSRVDAYFSLFDAYRGPGQTSLLQQKPAALLGGLRSMEIYSDLPHDQAFGMAFERQLGNIAMSSPFTPAENRSVLGCASSYISRHPEAGQPANRLSLGMRVPFQLESGQVVRPFILSVSAPALDDPSQPEFDTYVNNGRLDADAYRSALHKIGEHVVQAAVRHPDHEVVLSSYGMESFLGGLPTSERDTAEAIGALEMGMLIRALRARGKRVGATALEHDRFWSTVDAWLAAELEEPVTHRGPLPGNWLTDRTLLVNSGDPHALVGNLCEADNSMDGFVGRDSLAHETHALGAMLHNVVKPPLASSRRRHDPRGPYRPFARLATA